jgi:hypothetical protein
LRSLFRRIHELGQRDAAPLLKFFAYVKVRP